MSRARTRPATASLDCDDDDDVDKPCQACTAAASTDRRRLASRPAPSEPPVENIPFRPGGPPCADRNRRGCNERTPEESGLTSSPHSADSVATRINAATLRPAKGGL